MKINFGTRIGTVNWVKCDACGGDQVRLHMRNATNLGNAHESMRSYCPSCGHASGTAFLTHGAGGDLSIHPSVVADQMRDLIRNDNLKPDGDKYAK